MSVVSARLCVSTKLRATDGELASKLHSIQSRSEVAEILEIPQRLLRTVLFGRREREKYRVFDIPKRGGGIRTIKAPPKNLKILQEKLNRILSTVYKPKACVHGFATNRSVRTNADVHHGRKWVLNVDLADFFGDVTIGRIIGALMSPAFGVGKQAATTIAQIACLADGVLPQGSPCSPVISNIVAYDLDVRLTSLAHDSQCSYSRYADDISFSTSKPRFPAELAAMARGEVTVGKSLAEAIEGAGFRINLTKVRLQNRLHRQVVTGLTVNEFPNVSRIYIRELRAILHSWRARGYEMAQAKLNSRLELFGKHIRPLDHYVRGKVAYLEAVRGADDPVVRKLLKELQVLLPDFVRKLPSLANIAPSPLRGHRSPVLGACPSNTILVTRTAF